MDTSDDIHQLREYAETRSEAAFAALVSRHINLVYSVAMRCTGNDAQAQEITQAVFVILARKAGSLRRESVLAGWLFKTARLTAANHLRSEIRRARREQEAFMQSIPNAADSDANWKQIAPLLDEAIAGLGAKDRNAVVLRFLEDKNLREVGAAMGTNEDAAKMRVSRALEKLRKFFSKRGVTLSGTALAGVIAANSIHAAPSTMAAGVTAAAAGGVTATASTLALAKGTIELMSWTKINIAIGVAVAALLVAAHQWHENTKQARLVAALQEQLRAEQQKTATQQTAIETLRQEKAAVVEEKRRSEQAASRNFARERAAVAAALAKSPRPSNSDENAISALAKLLDDPAVQESMRKDRLKDARKKYAPLIKQLNLPPDAADKFLGIIASEDAMDGKEVVGLLGGETRVADIQKAQDEEKQKQTADLQELLGASGFAQYEEFNRQYAAAGAEQELTAKVNAFNTDLGGSGMTDQQMKQLSDVLRANPEMEPDMVESSEDISALYEKMQERSQRVAAQVSAFLTPDQVAAWNKFQAAELEDSKTELETMQKVMEAMALFKK